MSDPNMKKFADTIRIIVKEEIQPVNEKVEAISKQVTSIREDVKSISEQVANLTEKVDGEIIPTLEIHTKYIKKIADSQEKNDDNIGRLDKRLSETEAGLGIQPPPEFQIIK